MKLAQEAHILAEQSGDAEFMGLADYRIASAALLMGDYATAAETGVAGTKLLQPFASSLIRFGGLVQTFIGSFSAVALAELGRFDEAVAIGRAAFNTATAENHAYSISVSCFGIGHALSLRGDIDEALGPLEEGLRRIEIHSLTATIPWVAGRAAYVFAKLGHMDKLDAAMGLTVRQDTGQLAASMTHSFGSLWLARACMVVERFSDARRFAILALNQDGLDEKDGGVMAWAEWTLIECARLQNKTDPALLTRLNQVLLVADQKGMQPLRAHCLATYVGLSTDAGAVVKALELANELGMSPLANDIA